MATTRVRSLRRDRFRDGRPIRVGSEIVVRSIDHGGSTIRALRLTAKLRMQGSALAAALARPAVSSALADVSYRTGAGHTTGVSVVYQQVEPLTTVVRESAVSAEQEFEVAWRGADGLLDQMPDPEPINGSPTRAVVDWHEVGRVDDWRGGGRRTGGVAVSGGFRQVPVPHSPPWLRFQSPLIEPDVRISRIRLSDEIMPSHTESSPFAGQGA